VAGNDTYLVTGAAGHLGRAVLNHLLDGQQTSAEKIIATTRNPRQIANFASRGVLVREADFDDEASLDRAFAGASRALIISTDKLDSPGQRVRQHGNAIRAAVKAGVSHVVYTSMMNPEPGSPIPFAPDHYETERLLREASLTWSILRNCWYTDFLLQSLPRAIATGQLFSAAGDEGVAYVTRDDCARTSAAILASTRSDKTVQNLTGPSAVSHGELARIAAHITGKAIRVIPVSAEQLLEGLKAAGLPLPVASLLVAMDVNTRAGNVARVSRTVQEATARAPQSVRAFLEENASSLGG
jgi:NAD(P)H dehydrogenase (quinone)